jgi:glycosyltransferase involved in cell wall biosynthesis
VSRRVLLVQHCPRVGGSAFSAVVTAKALQRHGYDVDVVLAAEGPFVDKFHQIGCDVRILPHHNWLRPGGVLRCGRRWLRELAPVRAFGQLLRETEYAAVYVNTIVSVAAAIAARRSGVPCLWHIRELFDDVGGEMVIPTLGGRRLVRRVIWKNADQVVVNSNAVAANVLGTTDHQRLAVVSNSVDDGLFLQMKSTDPCRQEFDLPGEGFVVGVPGTLRPMKGHPFLLETAAELLKPYPNLVFAVTGDGDSAYVEELSRLTEHLGIQSRVRFLGRVNDMRSFYGACDVICIPSRAEPFGRVAIEAFAAGKPVVASAVGGLQEIIEHGVTGFLVPYNDTRQMQHYVERLLQDPLLRQHVGAAARLCAKERYTEAHYSSRVVDLVNQLTS